MPSVHYLSNWLIWGKKSTATSPATFDHLQIRVAVISNKVLQDMIRQAEDQRAILPL